MKRNTIIAVLVIGMLLNTGCAKMIKLTDEETDMISEYVAGFVVNDEANYTEKLITPSPTPSPAPTPTLEPGRPTPSPTLTPNQPGNTGDKNIQANADFSSIVGIDGINIAYKSYEIGDEYYDSDGSYLQASNGKKLLKISFDLKNTTDTKKDVLMKDTSITYQIDLKNGKFEKAMLTIMNNDLIFLNTSIENNASKEASLFFSVPNDFDIAGSNVIISKGDKTAIIKLSGQ